MDSFRWRFRDISSFRAITKEIVTWKIPLQNELCTEGDEMMAAKSTKFQKMSAIPLLYNDGNLNLPLPVFLIVRLEFITI